MNQRPLSVKEVFYSLQGEGARAGRPAVFCRFSKCNLWNGKEQGRTAALCQFCDTDFRGTDGQNGGIFPNSESLALHLFDFWPKNSAGIPIGHPYLVCTGGEPALQLTTDFVHTCQKLGFEVAIETNGTLPIPPNIDWVCVSPKGRAPVVLSQCDELKLVYPQKDCPPSDYAQFPASYYFLSPMAPANKNTVQQHLNQNTHAALDFCLKNPQWHLSLQSHKWLGID